MKRLLPLFKLLFLLALLAPLDGAYPLDPAPLSGASVSVNADIVKARLKEVEASPDLDEKTKSTLTELYRKTLSHIETEGANNDAAEAFSKSRQTASAQARSISDKLEQAKSNKNQVQ